MTTVEILMEPTNCPFCGSNSFQPRMQGQDRFFGVPGVFQLVRCDVCRHVYMNPRPTVESIPALYPKCYSPHQSTQPAAAAPAGGASATTAPTAASRPARQPWYLSKWARAIPGLRALYYWLCNTQAEVIPERPRDSARALEIGCAGGKFLERLRRAGWDAQGVELMPEPAAEARQRGFPVQLGMLEEAHYPDAEFDAVFAWMVLEHLTDPLASMQEILRILKPRGWFAFNIPNTGSWEARVFGRYWSDHELPRHFQHFTVPSIKRFLLKAGFTDVRVIHQRTVYGLIGSLSVVCKKLFPRSKVGPELQRWFLENPPLWVYLALSAVMKIIVPLLGSGRITVLARKP